MYSLGEKIIELRKQAGISQEELSLEIGVSRQAISQWEADMSSPKADKLKALCEYFNVKPEYFLFENSAPEQLVPEEAETAVAQNAEEQPVESKSKKPSAIKNALIICSVIFMLLAAVVMLFIAWLNEPEQDSFGTVSSSSWHYDMVTVLQIAAGVIIFVAAVIVVLFIVKFIKNRKK